MQIMTRYDFVPRGQMSAFGQCCSHRPGKRANVGEKNCGLGILFEFFLNADCHENLLFIIYTCRLSCSIHQYEIAHVNFQECLHSS